MFGVTARLDLLAHGASAATRAARFPDDDALEASAVRRPRERSAAGSRTYDRVLRRPGARRARDRRRAGFRRRRRDGACEMATTGVGAVRTLKDVADREPEAFAAWLGDPAAAPHGGESLAALIERAGGWLAEFPGAGRRDAGRHPCVVRSRGDCLRARRRSLGVLADRRRARSGSRGSAVARDAGILVAHEALEAPS